MTYLKKRPSQLRRALELSGEAEDLAAWLTPANGQIGAPEQILRGDE